VVILTPNLGIVRIGNQIAADRYSYLPLMSGAVVLSTALCLLVRQHTLSLLGIGLTMVGLGTIAWLIPSTSDQCRTWKNSEALWTHTLSHGPGGNAEVYNFMGKVRAKQGVPESAMALYQESLRLNPRYADAHNNLGVCLAEQSRFDEAMVHFSEALAVNPHYAEARMNLGSIMATKGRLEEAVNLYFESIDTYPGYALAHKNLGTALLKLGRTREAVKHYAEALWLDPRDPDADNIFQNVVLRYGDLRGPAASACLSRLLIDPHDFAARQGLIEALRELEGAVTSP
jgi:tetratricopeptide (TPR) repeat protein